MDDVQVDLGLSLTTYFNLLLMTPNAITLLFHIALLGPDGHHTASCLLLPSTVLGTLKRCSVD